MNQFDDKQIYIILDNTKYSNNLGSILRIAQAFSVSKVFVCRRDKKSYKSNQLAIIKKISRGASENVDWELVQDSEALIQKLKEKNFYILSVDIRTDLELNSKDYSICYPLAIIFGSEAYGVDNNIIDMSDKVIKIPMSEEVNSLNVAAAVAIVTYKIRESF